MRSIKSKAPILVVVMKRSNVGDGPNHGNWMVRFFFLFFNYIFLYTMNLFILANDLLLHIFLKEFFITSYKLYFFETINYTKATSFNAIN